MHPLLHGPYLALLGLRDRLDRVRIDTSTYRTARILELEFHVPSLDAVGAERLLATLESAWPSLTPVRFGVTEPLRGRFDAPAGRRDFAKRWTARSLGLFWSGRQPGASGRAWWSRGAKVWPGTQPEDQLRLSIDADDLANDPAACDRAVELFVAVAAVTRAHFAAGYVLRNAHVGDGWVGFGAGSDLGPAGWINGPAWPGVPAGASWLSWYGSGYRDLVRPSLSGAITHGDGTLVRLGSAPMDVRELYGVARELPADLIAGREIRREINPETGRETILPWDRVPADVIPSIE